MINMDKIEEVNNNLQNKTTSDEEEDMFTGLESAKKILKRNPSGPAVTVVKPPADFKLDRSKKRKSQMDSD